VAPVTTSVLTTIAAFLPLALLPGVLGEFMRVIPIVVSVAIAVSLLEAYWMLPAHVIAFKVSFARALRVHRWRERFTHAIRLRYTRLLLKVMRRPWLAVFAVVLSFAVAGGTLTSGSVRVDFFQGDAVRLFYVSMEMPAGTALVDTSRTLQALEAPVRAAVEPDELRGTLTYAGRPFTETDNIFGDVVGQVMVSLNPARPGDRHVFAVADAVDTAVANIPGPKKIWILRLKDGPPTQRAVKLKVRGDFYPDIFAVVSEMQAYLESDDVFRDISLDYRPGNPELVLRHNGDGIQRSDLAPEAVGRAVSLHVDGEIVTEFQYHGEKVRVRAAGEGLADIEDFLRHEINSPDGSSVALSQLCTPTRVPASTIFAIMTTSVRSRSKPISTPAGLTH
jgi:multidrug efflux pump subunit AcrB